MLEQDGFNLWADGYNQAAGLSDEGNSYFFKTLLRQKTLLYIGFSAKYCTRYAGRRAGLRCFLSAGPKRGTFAPSTQRPLAAARVPRRKNGAA